MATKDSVRPTKKQRELLSYIESFIGEHGYSPSYREIMRGLSYTSVATVALHVNSLIKRGHLRKREHSARSIELVKNQSETMVAIVQAESIENEDWLIKRITKAFESVEKQSKTDSKKIDELQVLVDALRILKLDEAADNFGSRLSKLQDQNGVE